MAWPSGTGEGALRSPLQLLLLPASLLKHAPLSACGVSLLPSSPAAVVVVTTVGTTREERPEDEQRPGELTEGCGEDVGVESGVVVVLGTGLERSTCTLTEESGHPPSPPRRVGLSDFEEAVWGDGGCGEGAGLLQEPSSEELADDSSVDFLAALSAAAGCCERELCPGERLSSGVATQGLQLPWTPLSKSSSGTGAGSIASPPRDSFC